MLWICKYIFIASHFPFFETHEISPAIGCCCLESERNWRSWAQNNIFWCCNSQEWPSPPPLFFPPSLYCHAKITVFTSSWCFGSLVNPGLSVRSFSYCLFQSQGCFLHSCMHHKKILSLRVMQFGAEFNFEVMLLRPFLFKEMKCCFKGLFGIMLLLHCAIKRFKNSASCSWRKCTCGL